MYGYIYKTTNLINNKIYIGQHKANKFEPTKYIGSGILLTEAIIKYGIDNFKCELLHECSSQEDLNYWEVYYISLFNSTDKTIGYNIADGGNCIKITDQEYFNAIRPSLQHSGTTNGNCKLTLEDCNNIKKLLDQGLSSKAVAEIIGVSSSLIASIRRGHHWSCKDDKYKCTVKTIKAKCTKNKKLSAKELAQHKKNICSN